MSISVHSRLAPKNRKNFACSGVRKSTKSSFNVQPDKAVIVNVQKANAPIEIGFAAPWKDHL